jgi:hypothetical protein
MAKVVRIGVAVDPPQREALFEIARREGRTVSDVIRRLIDSRLARGKRQSSNQPREAQPAA